MRVDISGWPQIGQRYVAARSDEARDAAQGDERAEDGGLDDRIGHVGIRVSLSEAGKAQASDEAKKNQDIDESSLPDSIKQILKMIRKLKEDLREKMAELQSVATDQGLDDETRMQRMEGLQSEVASLNGAISQATASLMKAMREAGLSGEQMLEAAQLLMK
ncbi:hypothetical protein thsps21_42160 [Pseudomonas sp. No.21]|uniref:hypothetical protein n=1 Tax=Pseudomonas TaxID=286 RepID=UPI001F1CD86B|nr:MULTISPECIES: hypothetical protein [Pseudomonas]MDW3712387.1 hypothetical protein [Pseudomonas sp. 2023EL-01195]GJN45926.1 hypothetical protein TUM20249_19120 [Pseudomonas tohonis]